MYNQTSALVTVNEARKALLAHGNRKLENIPPTRGALEQHILRIAFQAGYVWSQTLVAQPEHPSPVNFGWHYSNGWHPVWSLLPEASKACSELLHCGCKRSCRERCKCFKANLNCTELCACAGLCSTLPV